jgi:hypothetical protein
LSLSNDGTSEKFRQDYSAGASEAVPHWKVVAMKKLLIAVIAAVGGLLAWKKVNADRNAEADLWAEATDKVE